MINNTKALDFNEKYSDVLSRPFEYSKDHIMDIQQLDDSALTRIQKDILCRSLDKRKLRKKLVLNTDSSDGSKIK